MKNGLTEGKVDKMNQRLGTTEVRRSRGVRTPIQVLKFTDTGIEK